MRVHFIAIGGSAMHNLAIALKRKGDEVSGSDDEIFEPSKSRLKSEGLLPATMGWSPDKIDDDLDAVILGMHAKADNPELLEAKRRKIPIFSFPEYLYEQSRSKKRVVIGGSHGKTTITAMVMHVLNREGIEFDYMVGAQLRGFEVMVRLSESAGIMVFEGDEYLSSALDRRPKFHLYKPDIALISGIAWDHINVFPTYEMYVEQFRIFAQMIPPGGSLVYFDKDEELRGIAADLPAGIRKRPYSVPEYKVVGGRCMLTTGSGDHLLRIFGRHNMTNLEGARIICEELGVGADRFYTAISSFEGASKRLELIDQNDSTAIFKDFAHSPSKLKATVEAMKEQYPDRKLVACMELHTYSSLSDHFLSEYKNSMAAADKAMIYFNPHALSIKKLPPLDKSVIGSAFYHQDIEVFDNSELLRDKLLELEWTGRNLLMMSSGDFDGTDLRGFAAKILNK